MITSIVNWIVHMPVSTGLVISGILYITTLFVVAVCDELDTRGIVRETVIHDISLVDLDSVGFHVIAMIASFFWFITVPLAFLFVIGKVSLSLIKLIAKKAVDMFVTAFDSKKLENIEKDIGANY